MKAKKAVSERIDKKKEYETMTGQREHAIAFTND
jgi:hypothetical protein